MKIESTRFGTVEVDEKDVLCFEHGMLGFPEERRFAFIAYTEESPFAFLQALNSPELTFMVVDAFQFFGDYQFELEDAIATELGVSPDEPPQILNIVTVPEKTEEMTANLMAPLVINRKSGKARQVVLENPQYSLRQRLFPDGFPKDATSGEGK